MTDLAIFDLRLETGERGSALKRVLDREDSFACDTRRRAVAKILKFNVPTLRSALVIRSDGKFVPVVFLAPPEDHFHEFAETCGVFPLRGN